MINLSDNVKIARADALKAAIDAGASGGKILFYAGTRPAPGEAPAGELIISFVLPYPCGAADSVGLRFFSVAQAQAVVNGIVSWARLTDSADNWIFDGDVKQKDDLTTQAEFKLDTLQFYAGAFGNLTGLLIAEGG